MTKRSDATVHDVETDPGAELGLHNPVRDKDGEACGDAASALCQN